MGYSNPDEYGWIGVLIAMYIVFIQAAWFCSQFGAAAWTVYVRQYQGQALDVKLALNQNSLTSWFTQQVLTWISIAVVLYAERRPYKPSSAFASFFTVCAVLMAWLNLQVSYWYNVTRIEQPLWQEICADDSSVPSGYCASLKTAAWCSGLGFIGLCALAICGVYQIFRAGRTQPVQLVLLQKCTMALMAIVFSGYVIWCASGCVLLTNHNYDIAVTNGNWVNVWYTSVPCHLLVIASISTAAYTIGDLSERVAWIAMICAWANCIGILPLWVYLMDTFLDQSLCSNGNGVDCAAREGLLAGIGIVAITSWFLAFVLTGFWLESDFQKVDVVQGGAAYDGAAQDGDLHAKYSSQAGTPIHDTQYGTVTNEFGVPASSYMSPMPGYSGPVLVQQA